MAIGDLFVTMSAFIESCKKRISQATRGGPSKLVGDRRRRRKAESRRGRGEPARFLGRTAGFVPSLSGNRRADDGREKEKKGNKVGEELDEAGGVVWRRTILMGEKCRPPEFAGVIHYDASGRQVSEYATPLRTPTMTPSRSHLPFDDEEDLAGKMSSLTVLEKSR